MKDSISIDCLVLNVGLTFDLFEIKIDIFRLMNSPNVSSRDEVCNTNHINL
jgi:hypothetical protein